MKKQDAYESWKDTSNSKLLVLMHDFCFFGNMPWECDLNSEANLEFGSACKERAKMKVGVITFT